MRMRVVQALMVMMLWPALAGAQEQQQARDPNAIYCRPPQRMTESRNLGPRICRTNAQWDELHAKGLDISADGRGYVQSEKFRSIQMCGNGSC